MGYLDRKVTAWLLTPKSGTYDVVKRPADVVKCKIIIVGKPAVNGQGVFYGKGICLKLPTTWS
jgi:hypothetical protein